MVKKYRKVVELWEKAKHTSWDLGPDFISISLLRMCGPYKGKKFERKLYAESDEEEYRNDLDTHLNTIDYWIEQLEKYKNREDEIPNEYAIEMLGDRIEDGNHRLVAAFVLRLEKFPVIEEE